MVQQKEKRSFADIAHMSALKPEEVEEATREAEENGGEAAAQINGEGRGRGSYGLGADQTASKLIRMEHVAPVYRVTPKPDRKMMFGFLLYHTYLNAMGIIAVLVGIAAIVMVIVSMKQGADGARLVLFGVVAFVFILNSPLTMIFKAKKYAEQTADPANAITYTFSSTGFDLSRENGDYASYDWNTFAKIRETGTAYFCYLAKNQAFVIPKDDLGADREGFASLVKEKVDEKKLRFKKEEM